MTHPLRDPKANGGKKKVKQGEPFDPEDLTRRLMAHLAEQKAKSERRRAAREAKAAADALHYHHVPKVAASAFERTMTPDTMRHVPKLAQPAIKAHLEAIKIEDPGSVQTMSLKKTQAKDQAVLERHLLSSRNQFQWSQDMEDANEADIERDIYKLPQRTFNSEFAHLRSKPSKSLPRPMSTGDVFWEEHSNPVSPKPKSKPVQDRKVLDWAQRDDDVDRKKEHPTPLLRKKDSNWILLGMKSIRHHGGIENADISPPHTANPVKTKGGFLARFKRHPS